MTTAQCCQCCQLQLHLLFGYYMYIFWLIFPRRRIHKNQNGCFFLQISHDNFKEYFVFNILQHFTMKMQYLLSVTPYTNLLLFLFVQFSCYGQHRKCYIVGLESKWMYASVYRVWKWFGYEWRYENLISAREEDFCSITLQKFGIC